jgi:hypothetical protein
MLNVHVVLLILAFILVMLEGLKVPAARVSFGWLGLAFWLLSLLIG